ncbi:MAG: ribonuclease HII [Desulfobulbaceae bacterium]|nr:ribonuclease HII [Desulfobulbaceae bacterium]
MPETISLWPDSSGADTFSIERSLFAQGYATVAGTDEVGRGPLAGPVVAACVVLPPDCDYQIFQDSKKITEKARKALAVTLREIKAMIGIGIVSPADIDRINILQASLLAMKKAVEQLSVAPDFLLVDGKFKVPLALAQQPLIKGDSRSASVAAASIIAKVTRDEMMEAFHERYPVYNFKKHKGYPTAEHRRLIKEHGPCGIHRLSFKPVRACLENPKK